MAIYPKPDLLLSNNSSASTYEYVPEPAKVNNPTQPPSTSELLRDRLASAKPPKLRKSGPVHYSLLAIYSPLSHTNHYPLTNSPRVETTSLSSFSLFSLLLFFSLFFSLLFLLSNS
jgi:hypothetical protein